MNNKGEDKHRRSLIERVKDTAIRDPASHARMQVLIVYMTAVHDAVIIINHLQVSELDKAAINAFTKRKICNRNIERDMQEVKHIDDQLELLRLRCLKT